MNPYAWTPGRWALLVLTVLGANYAPDLTALLWLTLILAEVEL